MNKKGKKSSKVTKKTLKNKGNGLKNQPMSFDDIKKILADTAIQQKKNDRKMKKTDKIIEEIKLLQKETAQQQKENAQQQKETDRKTKETDRKMKENALQQKENAQQQKETDKITKEIKLLQKETAQQMKETDKKLNKMSGDLGNQWGVLGENLVSGNLAKRLKEKNIQVERVATNLKDKHAEFDIIAINGKEVVVVEVKCTLDPSDIDKFEKNIKQFKKWWPSFADNKTVYGAMAFLMGENNQAKEKAEKRGFFVISATGDVVIENKDNFQPKVFC